MTSRIGKTSSIYSKPGPQAGTLSSGKLCSHNCRDAIAAPAIDASAVMLAYIRCPSLAGLCSRGRTQSTAINAKTARCIMHIGQASMLLNGSTKIALPSKPAQPSKMAKNKRRLLYKMDMLEISCLCSGAYSHQNDKCCKPFVESIKSI